jgi:hypothetical protein
MEIHREGLVSTPDHYVSQRVSTEGVGDGKRCLNDNIFPYDERVIDRDDYLTVTELQRRIL